MGEYSARWMRMSDLDKLAKIMKKDWDRRVKHDYRFWMSDGYETDEAMWASGERDFEIVMEGFNGSGEKTILELGCGVGRLLRAAGKKFKKVIGVDVSDAALAKARELLGAAPNVELVLCNGVDLSQIPSESIDCVVSFASLTSIPTEIIARYIAEFHRVLKPGGELRLQVYLGDEQGATREDTLHLRCYREENFRKAIEAAGFDIAVLKDLVLPFQVSFKDIGIEAKLAFLVRSSRPSTAAENISRLLLPSGEFSQPEGRGNEIEYWMTVNHAKHLAESGDIDRARHALDYAEAVSKSTTIDVRDILSQIVSEIAKKENERAEKSQIPKTHEKESQGVLGAGDFLSRNLDVLKSRFPEVYEEISKFSPTDTKVEVRTSKNGPVLFLDGQCLDHADKPTAAAEKWVQRSLQEKRFLDATEVVVVGLGAGYHLEEIVKQTEKAVSLIEPNLAVFRAALESRDLTECLKKIKSLSIGEKENLKLFETSSELLVRPQSLVVYSAYLPKIKEKFYGTRGLKSLHPTIMVVGPMQGGTLPIAGYTSRALQILGQRVREMDVSPFAGGYKAFDGYVKDPRRIEALHNNYLEMISQTILESILEKKIDILLCMAQAPVSGRVLNELRSKGVITVLWFMEDYLRFTYWREMARYYDFVFTIQNGECIDLIKQAGAGEVHYLPMACDPAIHAPLKLSPEERAEWGSPASFVGAGYHNRQQVFATFADQPFKIWGTEWPGCRPFDRLVQAEGRRLTPEEYIKIFNATDVNINLHSSRERDGVDPTGDFVNPRTFELASAGAFQLVDERSLLPEMFEPGKEIITFNSTRDLHEKVAYYLKHPEERKAIAAKARDRVLREHTYGHRIRDMLSIIYSSKFEQLKNREDTGAWKRMLERAERHPELKERCKAAFDRGEEPVLDGLVWDILAGKGKLSETEQKLLFLYHVRKQIIRMKQEEAGG